VPLHILEEVLDVLQQEDSNIEDEDTKNTFSGEEILSLSIAAVQGIQSKKTMKLQGIYNSYIGAPH
jgi:hypothetical protein